MCGHAVSNTARPNQSRAEQLVQELNEQDVPESLDSQLAELNGELESLDGAIDSQYSRVLSQRQTASEDGKAICINSAAEMQQLSRDQPEVLQERPESD